MLSGRAPHAPEGPPVPWGTMAQVSSPTVPPSGKPDREAPAAGASPARWRRVPRAPGPRPVLALSSLAVMCALLLGGLFLPVPYVIERPGPAIDVLGAYQGQKILTISGREQYPTTGHLMMTTVSVSGGPGYPVTPAQVMVAWADPGESLLPREAVFPEGETKQQTTLQNAVDMSTSQQDAVAVALTRLKIPFTRNVTVAGVLEGGAAQSVLKPGDVIVSVQGQRRTTTQEYRDLTSRVTPGSSVAMVVRRDGKELSVKVPTREVDGATRMGIVLAPGYDFPVSVKVTLADVGGPSAGTMFALSVYDELTPGALTGGQSIAGTGTIDTKGTVGAIGGIRQKMIGARTSGARYFLAPAANCDEVTGHIPAGLSVVKVSTFDEALTAVRTIGSKHSASGLPTCG